MRFHRSDSGLRSNLSRIPCAAGANWLCVSVWVSVRVGVCVCTKQLKKQARSSSVSLLPVLTGHLSLCPCVSMYVCVGVCARRCLCVYKTTQKTSKIITCFLLHVTYTYYHMRRIYVTYIFYSHRTRIYVCMCIVSTFVGDHLR